MPEKKKSKKEKRGIERNVVDLSDMFPDDPEFEEKGSKSAGVPEEKKIKVKGERSAKEIEAGAIERGVSEVFDKYTDADYLDEKSQKVAEIPADIDIQIAGEDEAIESKESEIEHGVSEVFDKYEAAFDITGKQQEIVETPVKIEIDAVDKDDAAEDRAGASRVIYAAVGILIVLVAVTVAKLFKPAGQPEQNLPRVTVDAYKIDRPLKKVPAATVLPLETASRQKSEKNFFENTAPRVEAPGSPEQTSKIGEPADLMPEILAFLMKWKTAWENTAGNQGDMDAYMSFYSDGFESKGFDKSGWMREKAQTNRRKQLIRIALADIQITKTLPDGRVEVSFLQDYSSSNFSEKSIKTLMLKKEKTGWEIVGAEDSTGDVGSTSPESTANPVPVYPYTIHVASYREKDVSNRSIEALRRDGFLAFSSYVEIPGKGAWYRIFVNYYETLDEARHAALKLKHHETVYATTVKKPYVIQVGIFDSENELKQKESDLRAKGYTPYRVPDAQHKGRTKLCIGAYDSIKDASAEKQNLQHEHFATSVVKR